ncbi:MAG: AmmeMemoRadiSam system protein A [Oscillospiraceae bacterium]|nr:AmmeMemoRadiSam system protein A [Oscillospiraceae bacterium]
MLIKAYTLPHPPLAIPEVGKGKEKKISKTLDALDEVGKEIKSIAPETIIFITPHSTVYSDYFHISPGSKASGDFSRFGVPNVKIETNYDEELAEDISKMGETLDLPVGIQGEQDKTLDHATMVPMYFINKYYSSYKSLRISQSGLSESDHYLLGMVIDKAVKVRNRKTVIIASSDLSHRLSKDGPYGFNKDGPEFDRLVELYLSNADFLSLMNLPSGIRRGAGECGYNSLMVLIGCLDKQKVMPKLLSYEAPFGVGYAVASFEAIGNDENRNILQKHVEHMSKLVEATRNIEDDYQKLARQSLERKIMTGEIMSVTNELPQEMIDKRAGVFVSIHKDGALRGCIGTIAPTKKCIAEEIICNAISSGSSDFRFSPVTAHELPLLTYKVDVLSPPEPIVDRSELDVKRYGVIVTSGSKRGLLLPNLDGVDTVDDQINIASGKAGILNMDKISLERFEVVRHG